LGIRGLVYFAFKVIGVSLIISLFILIVNNLLSNAIFDLIKEIRDSGYLEGESKAKETLFIFFWIILPFSLSINLVYYLIKKEK